MAKTTLRELLTEAGIDWGNARIILENQEKYASLSDRRLDKKFDTYHGHNCPAFVAEDGKYVYFPVQYDGAITVNRVARDINHYIGKDDLPYFGSG